MVNLGGPGVVSAVCTAANIAVVCPVDAVIQQFAVVEDRSYDRYVRQMTTAEIGIVEQKVQTLTIWKKIYTIVGAVFIGTAGWIEAKIDFIGGMFNG